MKRLIYGVLALVVMILLLLSHPAVHAQEAKPAPAEEKPAPVKKEPPPPPPPPPDQINTKDGSILFGKIIQMTGDVLKVETVFDGEVEVKWAEVKRLETGRSLPFAMKDGTVLKGTAKSEEDGKLTVKTETVEAPARVKMEEVAAINAPPKKHVTYRGALGTGGSISRGNSKTRTATGTFDFQARSKRQRLSINGYVNYADDGDNIITRNSRAAFKYDFFLSDRIYLYAATFFEGDTFQDLTLRAAMSTGVGLEIIKAEDIESGLFKGLEWNLEAGVAYFVEDYRRGADEDFVAARWATRLDWPIMPDRLKFFHMHEGYPSLDDRHDVYIISQTGLGLTIVKNFVGAVQVNHRWDNTPKPTFDRLDTLYLWTLGYSFSF